MKVLLIDDEKKARQLLRGLLEENCPQITQIEEAEALPEGVKKIHQFNPEIVFLDIEMPGYSGLQIFEFFDPSQINFEIVFITAYSEYAIKAFELNAIDYLLKPLREEQLLLSIEKAIKQIGKSKISERLEELSNTLNSATVRKVGLPVADGILFVKFDDIIMLEADRMYTKVFTQNEGEMLVSKPMKFFLDTLEGLPEFHRTHRSFLINLKYIKQYISRDGGYIMMENDQRASLSRERREPFFEIMKKV